jgi:hypothetical protein
MAEATSKVVSGSKSENETPGGAGWYDGGDELEVDDRIRLTLSSK